MAFSKKINKFLISAGKVVSSDRVMWIFDAAIVFISYMAALVMVHSLKEFNDYIGRCMALFSFCAAVFLFVFFVSKNYKVIWRHSSLYDYVTMIVACLAATLITIGATNIMKFYAFYIKPVLLADFIASVMLILYRLVIKMSYQYVSAYFKARKGSHKKNLLIVGAGSAAALFINDLNPTIKSDYNIVGLIDDDPKKQNAFINGIKVIGDRGDIEAICEREYVDEIIFAIPSASKIDRMDIINICSNTGCKLMVMPGFDEIVDEESATKLRKVKIEDLLARDPIVLDDNGILENIKDKVVMVTGGGGSIGSELCRQIVKFRPKQLIIVDIYENNAYDLQNELLSKFSELNLEVLIASVRDKDRLESIFSQYKPNIIFHAAAHKHVPLMENSPTEAIKNNVFGTYNVAKCADKYGVEKFVMISTDKAVNPTNVMGATKRMCEMIIQAMNNVSKTNFVAVRFGNVLGSNGSVIPLFARQIENGGPVTVTHKDITRFFMTIPEAAQLVIQAACFADGGEIFVLDMGQPVRIYDLALNMIRLSGLIPDEDIKVKITGLRPGEKLYEELLMSEEGLKKTRHSKIFIGHPLDVDMPMVEYKLEILAAAVKTNDGAKIRCAVAEVVPTYHPANEEKQTV